MDYDNQSRVRKLKIFAINVNGWKNKRHTFNNIFHVESPDIILISEHGVKTNEEMKILNYDVHLKNFSNERYDGAAIAVKKGIKYRIMDSFQESYIAAKIHLPMEELIIVAGYQPPRRDYLPVHDFFRMFNRSAPVLLVGDLNARCGASGYTRRAGHNNIGGNLQMLLERNVVSRIGPDFPTYITDRHATKPDVILTNRNFHLNYLTHQGPLVPSDHQAILLQISCDPIQIPIKPRKCYNRAAWGRYEDILKNYEPSDLESATTERIEAETKNLQKALIQADAESIGKTTYKTLPHPAMTPEIKRVCEEFKIIQHHTNIHGPNREQWLRINELKVRYSHLVTQEKNRMWENIVEKINVEKDAKSFWSQINRIIGKQTPKQTKIKEDGIEIEEPEEIEKIFRRHWSKRFKISEEENREFDQDHEDLIAAELIRHRDRILPHARVQEERYRQLDLITLEELKNNIKSSKQRAPGSSGITKFNLDKAPDTFLINILNVMNAALNTGYFPAIFKTSKMIFIPKSGKSSTEVKNYRPISLLEFLGKTLERILNERLVTFLKNNNLQNEEQHGFRRGRGTETALAVLCEGIARAKAKRNSIDVVLRDVQGAFDRVWTEGLKYKILKLRLPPYLERIICNYISDRRSYIHIEGHDGREFGLETGVPQGSCLSPTLYAIYTSDIPKPLYDGSLTLQYADDVTQLITCPYRSVREIARYTANEIGRMNEFEKKWKIKTNKNKFKIIPISRRNTHPIRLRDEVYEYTSEGSVLGMYINSGGYGNNVKNRERAALAKLIELYKLKNLRMKTKRNLYVALVQSTLLYPTIPLHMSATSSMIKLQRIQNKAVLWVTDTRRGDRIRQEHLHAAVGLEAVNVTLHTRAVKIWERVMSEVGEETRNKITEEVNGTYHQSFRSSLETASQPRVPPLYVL